jgi:hypothetical protein
VGEGGFEPPRGCPHRILNPARLPVPPLARKPSALGRLHNIYGNWSEVAAAAMVLLKVEKALEKAVETALARAVRGRLQPIEIAKRLTRQMDLERQLAPRGVIVPNRFQVALSSEDYKRFAAFAGELEDELAGALRDHARAEDYVLVGGVVVNLVEDPKVRPGTTRISCQIVADSEGMPSYSIVLPDGRRVQIGPDRLVVGRSAQCDVVLNDPTVSRRHAELRRSGNEVVVVDLGSTNGTRVNGMLVRRQRLKDKDEIAFGNATVVFEAR